MDHPKDGRPAYLLQAATRRGEGRRDATPAEPTAEAAPTPEAVRAGRRRSPAEMAIPRPSPRNPAAAPGPGPASGGAPADSEEGRLLGLIAAGDEAALVSLYARVGGVVHATCLRILGDPDEAQDATAEAFWRFWSRADRYDPRLCSAMAWILTVARRIALDVRRSRNRHGAALERFEREARPGADSLEQILLDRREVADAFARLSPADRQLLEAAFFEGLSGSEISHRDSVALGTVKSRLRAALARLRIAWGRSAP